MKTFIKTTVNHCTYPFVRDSAEVSAQEMPEGGAESTSPEIPLM